MKLPRNEKNREWRFKYPCCIVYKDSIRYQEEWIDSTLE